MGAEEQVNPADFRALVSDVGEVKSLMGKMVEAISRITLLDERQQTVAAFMAKLDDRMGRMEERQHKAELAAAATGSSGDRIKNLELSVREMHIDRERDKARFGTVVWLVRGIWGVLGVGGVVAVLEYLGRAA